MQCRDVMLTLVYTCTAESTAAQCARLMRDNKLGFVPLVDPGGRLISVVTDRDLAIRVLADDKPGTTLLKEVASFGPLLTCRAEDSLESLEERMGAQKRARAVVVDAANKPIGIISLSDIARSERSAVRTSRLLREISDRESASIAHV